MTDQLDRVLKCAEAEKKGDAFVLPSGRWINLYLNRAGATLTINRVVELIAGDLCEATTHKGEQFVFSRADVMAASVAGDRESGGSARKAGFRG